MIITLLTALLLSSCKETENKATPVKSEIVYDLQNSDMTELISLITIDSCQYIMTKVYFGNVLTHKGNCTNHVNK